VAQFMMNAIIKRRFTHGNSMMRRCNLLNSTYFTLTLNHTEIFPCLESMRSDLPIFRELNHSCTLAGGVTYGVSYVLLLICMLMAV
jgi:hypothetical protein